MRSRRLPPRDGGAHPAPAERPPAESGGDGAREAARHWLWNRAQPSFPDPEQAVREALRVARPGAPMIFLEHVRSHLLPVALIQEALSPILVALQEDHFNRRAEEIVRRAGVQVESVDRWLLGFFNLIIGRAP